MGSIGGLLALGPSPLPYSQIKKPLNVHSACALNLSYQELACPSVVCVLDSSFPPSHEPFLISLAVGPSLEHLYRFRFLFS